ncbi:hypothetical protein ACJIZ3_021869 [Penstemon smallii]|uniref:Uncharacterized protein n=1 Tax=Penstemon smallii TaxID=265156 RepID=A0ABD3SMY1_9LAMI
MSQKREKEETELKVPENLPICTLPQTIHAPSPQLRTLEVSDPKVSTGACDHRTRSASSPKNPDLPENRGTSLKRPREVTRCFGSG